MAIGFLDSDKNNDLVTINEDKNEISTHFFSQETYRFYSMPSFNVDASSPNATIQSIVISKDNIKLQNLYVFYKKNQADKVQYLKIFNQTSQGVFEEFKESNINMLELPENY